MVGEEEREGVLRLLGLSSRFPESERRWDIASDRTRYEHSAELCLSVARIARGVQALGCVRFRQCSPPRLYVTLTAT